MSAASSKRIALVDYGIGNLRSVFKAVKAAGGDVFLTESGDEILAAEKVILPGVGAFGDGMAGLEARGLVPVVHEVVRRGTPLLGICVGMQLLFEVGEEMGMYPGLGILPGRVVRFPQAEMTGLKIPQTGWNALHRAITEHPGLATDLLAGLPEGSYAYFNHSYYCAVGESDDVLAWTDYGLRYASVVGRGNVFGVQFHPEKSQAVGLTILRNFVS
jgi:glutamine amidotransferase